MGELIFLPKIKRSGFEACFRSVIQAGTGLFYFPGSGFPLCRLAKQRGER